MASTPLDFKVKVYSVDYVHSVGLQVDVYSVDNVHSSGFQVDGVHSSGL